MRGDYFTEIEKRIFFIALVKDFVIRFPRYGPILVFT